MTAYRLHFEKSNLEAVKLIKSGKLGPIRFFNSVFSMQARDPNIRLEKEMGGGPLRDLGVYCINAARYLFGAEPTAVQAIAATGDDKRFGEVEEMVAATLRFPDERLASFICSFGAADQATYDVIGTKGALKLVNGYEYSEPVEMQINLGDRKQIRKFTKRDQFAPELLYFSECILNDREPEPSGQEGLADVRIIEALYASARTGKLIKVKPDSKRKRPSPRQEIRRPAIREPELVHARSGHRS
jgi:glucose-fructose oxidoreductase